MTNHRYRITVEQLGEIGSEHLTGAPLQFEADSRDDIPAIVERLRTRGDFSADDAAALGVGLKLFTGVMLKHRDMPLFAPLQSHFSQFMQNLKKGAPRA